MASPLPNVLGHQVALQRLQSAVEGSLEEHSLSDQQRQQVLDAAVSVPVISCCPAVFGCARASCCFTEPAHCLVQARIARQLQQALQIR